MEKDLPISDKSHIGASARKSKKEFSDFSRSTLPIKHWSHSSLMAFLRNPLAWYKRYVELIYDTPYSPSAIIGQAGHKALQHFYSGIEKQGAIDLGLEYLRDVGDFEINFGRARSRLAKKKKRASMEREYLQAISFYLARPPKYKVLATESVGIAKVDGLPLPIKAVSDLVVESRTIRGAVDIVDHKFVDYFSKEREKKALFILQALFNYYTVREKFQRPIHRFLVWECKKTRNADGSSQMRRYVIDFNTCRDEFTLFHRLLSDATKEISRPRAWLPNPSDLFEGENSFDIYRLGLVEPDRE